MAAGQLKKRLHASSVVHRDLRESCATKKKVFFVSPNKILNIKPHIRLEWDEDKQKVVATKEQIGITWRKLGPFVNPLPFRRNVLADVVSVPHEVFELKDLTGVLTYEVWDKQLTDTEKRLLTQFLPKGADAEEVVQSLLMGKNRHFGNPLVKWSSTLCSGKLHPDAILCQEERFTAYKRSYGLELQKYQNEYLSDNLLENLQKLKSTWMDCEGPERDIVERMRKGYADLCRNISTASERLKVVENARKEEKQQKLYIHSSNGDKYMSYFKISKKQHQLVKGMKQPDGIKFKRLDHILGDVKSLRVQPYEVYEKEERKKLHVHWLQLANRDLPSAFADWTERSLQRQRCRRSLEQEMKGNKIDIYQDEKLNPGSLLQEKKVVVEAGEGVMDTQDFENGEESVLGSSNSRHLQRITSLNSYHELESMRTESEGGSEEIYKPEGASSGLSKFVGDTNPTDPPQRVASLHSEHDNKSMNTEPHKGNQEILKPQDAKPVLPMLVGKGIPTEVSEQTVFLYSANDVASYSKNRQTRPIIPSHNGHHEVDALDLELQQSSQESTKQDGGMPLFSQFVGSSIPSEDAVEHQVCLPSAKDAWLEVGMPDSFYDHTRVNHEITSASELSLAQPRFIRERPAHWTDLETDTSKQDAKEILLNNSSDVTGSGFPIDNESSFPSPYIERDRNELFHPIIKRQRRIPLQLNDQAQVGLQFLGRHDVSLETGHCPPHLHEQQQLLEQRQQMRDTDYYMQQVVHTNMYSNSGVGSRYPTPSQELFAPVHMQGWSVDPTQKSAPLQVLSAGMGLLSDHTSPAEHGACGGWSGMDVSSSSHCSGNRSNADGSLYSVLSQFNDSQSRSYDTSDQGVVLRNNVSGGISSNSNIFPHAGHQFNYLNGHESASVLKTNNLSWMNLPQQQNSGLHDSIGKPFLRSWNQ